VLNASRTEVKVVRVATLIWVFLALVAVLSIVALLLVKVIQFSIGIIKALRRTERLCELMREAASRAVEMSRQLGEDGMKNLPISCNFQLSAYQKEFLNSCKDKEIRYCGSGWLNISMLRQVVVSRKVITSCTRTTVRRRVRLCFLS